MTLNMPELESLDRQLHDAFRRAELPAVPDGLRADVESLSVASRSRGRRSFAARWPRSSVLATLVAVAAVIAIVGVALPLFRGQPQPGGPSPSASRPAPTATPSPTSSAQSAAPAITASIVADGQSVSWTNDQLSAFGSAVVAVGAAQVGGMMVVAANVTGPSYDQKPVIIASTDGTTWSQVSTTGPDFDLACLQFILPVPGGLLLVGQSLPPYWNCGYPTGDGPPADVLMWRSSDGLTWQRLSAAETAPFDRVAIVSMAAGPKGIVAFGFHYPLGAPAGANPENVVFHSLDGLNWTSRIFPDQNQGREGPVVEQVAAISSGFVGLGTNDLQSSGPMVGVVWYSIDGLTWTLATTPTEEGPTLYAATGSKAVVAVPAIHSDRSNDLWVSADGKTWEREDGSPLSLPNSWLTGNGQQILIVNGSSVYWSADGRTWHQGESTPAMSGQELSSTQAWIFGSTVIVVNPSDGLYVGRVGAH